jgi:hypothetical protein
VSQPLALLMMITRWYTSPGGTRQLIVCGLGAGCQRKRNGRRRGGVQMGACFLGAITILPINWPNITPVTLPWWGATRRVLARTVCLTWQGT